MSIQPGVGYTFTASSSGTNFNVQNPWTQWPLYVENFVCSPFKVHGVLKKTGDGGDYVVFEICPGTFNNQMPQVYDSVNEVWKYLNALAVDTELVLDFASTTSSIVYLRVGPDATTFAFPPTSPTGATDDPYPRIYSTGGALPVDSDAFGYVAIAKVNEISANVYTVEQYVTGSLWGDRLKLGTATAAYYYARI
jgi:hypothetical protein